MVKYKQNNEKKGVQRTLVNVDSCHHGLLEEELNIEERRKNVKLLFKPAYY